MIDIKNNKEIESMKKGGHMLAIALEKSLQAAKPGVTEGELDKIAEASMREQGGEPGFMKVPGYRNSICTATNEVIVHGIPGKYVLKDGDILCIDAGVYLNGLHTDMADTIIVGDDSLVPDEVKEFLVIGKKALDEGIKAAVGGNRVGHISKAIQDIVEVQGGYSIVRSLVGHGVGRELHEPPEVPGFLDKPIAKTPELVPGMTIAVEVIYAMGGPEVTYANDDGWTIKTSDDSVSAVFERSILITKGDPVILTR